MMLRSCKLILFHLCIAVLEDLAKNRMPMPNMTGRWQSVGKILSLADTI